MKKSVKTRPPLAQGGDGCRLEYTLGLAWWGQREAHPWLRRVRPEATQSPTRHTWGSNSTRKSKSSLGGGHCDLGKLVSSKVTWRATMTLFEERSRPWKPFWSEK